MGITYAEVPELPVILADEVSNIRYDYNNGLRIVFPADDPSAVWHLRIEDADTGVACFDDKVQAGAVIQTSKRYFIRWKFEIHNANGELIIEKKLSLKNMPVLVQMPVKTLGDPLSWVQYIEAFRVKHQAKVYCITNSNVLPLLQQTYLDIQFYTMEEWKDYPVATVATYYLGVFKPNDKNSCPIDYRLSGLGQIAANVLGVPALPFNVHFNMQTERPIKERFVCIAVQSTARCKLWNAPQGWEEVVEYLKEKGYRVLCIDKEPITGAGWAWNEIPSNAEDFTGDHPLEERVQMLQHADFFVGLASGLSWLAKASGIPVIMISGFSHPSTEFETPYRVINYGVCNSCWNDTAWDDVDYFHCPHQEQIENKFECTRLITATMVKNAIDRCIEDLKCQKN